MRSLKNHTSTSNGVPGNHGNDNKSNLFSVNYVISRVVITTVVIMIVISRVVITTVVISRVVIMRVDCTDLPS